MLHGLPPGQRLGEPAIWVNPRLYPDSAAAAAQKAAAAAGAPPPAAQLPHGTARSSSLSAPTLPPSPPTAATPAAAREALQQVLRFNFLLHACHPLTIAAANGNAAMVDMLLAVMEEECLIRYAQSCGGGGGGRHGGGGGGASSRPASAPSSRRNSGRLQEAQLTWSKPPPELPPGCPWITPLAAAALGGCGECVRLIATSIKRGKSGDRSFYGAFSFRPLVLAQSAEVVQTLCDCGVVASSMFSMFTKSLRRMAARQIQQQHAKDGAAASAGGGGAGGGGGLAGLLGAGHGRSAMKHASGGAGAGSHGPSDGGAEGGGGGGGGGVTFGQIAGRIREAAAVGPTAESPSGADAAAAAAPRSRRSSLAGSNAHPHSHPHPQQHPPAHLPNQVAPPSPPGHEGSDGGARVKFVEADTAAAAAAATSPAGRASGSGGGGGLAGLLVDTSMTVAAAVGVMKAGAAAKETAQVSELLLLRARLFHDCHGRPLEASLRGCNWATVQVRGGGWCGRGWRRGAGG